MAVAKKTNPYSVKGINITSPKGKAKWCKIVEPERTYNPKGTYSVDLVCDPNNEAVKVFVSQLEALRDKAFEETCETLGSVKAKGVLAKEVFQEETDRDGEPTGNIVFKFKMSNVDDRKPGQNKIEVVDAKRQPIRRVPLVGNDSEIRCVAFANPYYMASNKAVGISLLWSKMQLIELKSFGSGDDFEDEEGFTATDSDGFSDESSVEEDELDF